MLARRANQGYTHLPWSPAELSIATCGDDSRIAIRSELVSTSWGFPTSSIRRFQRLAPPAGREDVAIRGVHRFVNFGTPAASDHSPLGPIIGLAEVFIESNSARPGSEQEHDRAQLRPRNHWERPPGFPGISTAEWAQAPGRPVLAIAPHIASAPVPALNALPEIDPDLPNHCASSEGGSASRLPSTLLSVQ